MADVEPRIDTICQHVGPDDRVLDVGCVLESERVGDDGWLHRRLRAAAGDVWGVDTDEEGVERCQDMGYKVCAVDAETLPIETRFDAVVAGELIEHLSNPGRFLDGVREQLHADGRVVISTPNPWCVTHRRRAIITPPPCNDDHTVWFDETMLRQLLERHGFVVDAVEYPPPRPGGLSGACHRLGLDVLGATHVVVVAVA